MTRVSAGRLPSSKPKKAYSVIPARSSSPIILLPRPHREPAFREGGSSRRDAGPFLLARAAAVRNAGPGRDARRAQKRRRSEKPAREAVRPESVGHPALFFALPAGQAPADRLVSHLNRRVLARAGFWRALPQGIPDRESRVRFYRRPKERAGFPPDAAHRRE